MISSGLDPAMRLNPNLFKAEVEQVPPRDGFGQGLLEAGQRFKEVVALCADLTESTRMEAFAKAYPERFVEVGVAEQNLVTLASGMSHLGKVPFVSSYAAFSPGRNYEQIRTTIALNQANVKIVGSHGGVSVGPDGATHQMLEDVAMMRTLPGTTVIVPCDSFEASKATLAMAAQPGLFYLRLGREKSPLVTTAATPFEVGKAQVLRHGQDVTLIACGNLVYEALVAAQKLAMHNLDVEVINVATIKPLDKTTILKSVRKTGAVVTCEEHQINGGLGSAIAELLGEHAPLPLLRIGVKDRFGESGEPQELLEHFGLKSDNIVAAAKSVIKRKNHD